MLIPEAAAVAFNVGAPTSHGDGVVDVKMVPVWGLLVGIVGAIAILAGGVLEMIKPHAR